MQCTASPLCVWVMTAPHCAIDVGTGLTVSVKLYNESRGIQAVRHTCSRLTLLGNCRLRICSVHLWLLSVFVGRMAIVACWMASVGCGIFGVRGRASAKGQLYASAQHHGVVGSLPGNGKGSIGQGEAAAAWLPSYSGPFALGRLHHASTPHHVKVSGPRGLRGWRGGGGCRTSSCMCIVIEKTSNLTSALVE